MAISRRTGVRALRWTVGLLAVVVTNSHARPPLPAFALVCATVGSSVSISLAAEGVTPTYPFRQTRSLTRPQSQGRWGAEESITLLPSNRLEQDDLAQLLLSYLSTLLALITHEKQVILVWDESLSGIARGAMEQVHKGSAAALEAVEVRSCSSDALGQRLNARRNLILPDGSHPTLVILLCLQQNTTRVFEVVTEATRGRGGIITLLSPVPNRNGTPSGWVEEFQGGEEIGDLSSDPSSYMTEVTPNLHSLPPTDLQGRTLKVSAVDNWPFFGLRQTIWGGVEADAGIDVSILNALSHVLNFTYEVVLEEGGQWGGPQADGTVTGMIGMVARGEAHLAINEITITAARETVVDFTRPYFMESSACTSRAPKERSRAFAVLSPFTLQVWLGIGVSVMMIGLVLWVVTALIGQYRGKGVATPLQDLTFNMYRSLVVQSNRLPAVLWPLRLVFAAWYLYCFYMSALYSGTLTAVLALPVYEKPIDSLADLLEVSNQGFYPVTIKEISIDFLFQKATSGIYHQIGRLMTNEKHYVDSPSNGIARVLQGPAVYIDARLSMEIQIIVQGRDNFYLGRQSFFPQTYGIACMKGADYRDDFDRVLERLVQSGLVEKWKRDEFLKLGGRMSGGGGKRRGQTSAITITHLQGAFFLYVIGVTLALVMLLLERTLLGRSCLKPPPPQPLR